MKNSKAAGTPGGGAEVLLEDLAKSQNTTTWEWDRNLVWASGFDLAIVRELKSRPLIRFCAPLSSDSMIYESRSGSPEDHQLLSEMGKSHAGCGRPLSSFPQLQLPKCSRGVGGLLAFLPENACYLSIFFPLPEH